jgi:CRISPR-associated endonuclease Cas3-HD
MHSLPTFAAFFHALWGHDPFPWQNRLAAHVAIGTWPDWITLPTGTGKTSVIDIAVHALAMQAYRPAAERTAPARIVFAVNRRIVVDEAFERARDIAEKLAAALENPTSPLHPHARALATLAADPLAPALEAFPLRGGTFTDRSWARSAFQPLILSTTLDQLGSRLLFRGYGVSDFARPIHAALLANDSLLILDEAHTATAFSQTLQGIARLRAHAQETIPLPFQAIQLTATPPAEAEAPFQLDDVDKIHPIIAARLNASKPFETLAVPGAKGKDRHKKLAASIGEKARAYLAEGQHRVLIVVNRVATAEALLAELSSGKGRQNQDAKVELLTGRLRPLDRDALVNRLAETHQLKSSNPAAGVPPLILIATQCIEVGADFDFDALLTELAPLDNLRQRFGRLNRYGRPRISPATIVAPEEAVTTLDAKKLLAEVKTTHASDLLICARTNNSAEAEELETELRKLRRIEGEESDSPTGSKSSKWLTSISEDELAELVSSPDVGTFMAGLYDKWQDPQSARESSKQIGEWQAGGNAVLLCKTNTKLVKAKNFGVKNLNKELLATIDGNEALDEAEMLATFQKYAKSTLKDFKKHSIILIPIPEDFESDFLYDALTEALFPRDLEIHRFEPSTSRSEIQRLSSSAEIERIRKDPQAARRILIIPRDCHFIGTPQAHQNLGKGQDPIYGTALPEVWSWLNTLETPDFGLNAIAPQLPTGADLAALLAPTADAPILLAPHLDLLCQTSSEPHISPDPALYIHGPRRDFPEVGVILRNDLDGIDNSLAALTLSPPLATEAATVPLFLARQWLTKPATGNDESGDEPMTSPKPNDLENCQPFIVWRKGEAILLDNPADLRSGDTLILPASRREHLANLLPLPEDAPDQYEAAHLLSRDRLAIRFTHHQREQLAKNLPEPSRTSFLEITTLCFAIADDEETWLFDPKTWKAALPAFAPLLAESLPANHPQKSLWQHAAWKAQNPPTPRGIDDWKFIPYPQGTHRGAILINKSRVGATPWPIDPTKLGRQGNESDEEITLTEHSQGVAARASQNAHHLPNPLRACLQDAGLLHDIGKLDPRFQALLYGCVLHAVGGRPPLAKSNRALNPQAETSLRQALNLPDGFRHELHSAKIIADAEAWANHPERDLLLHLIASHHGRCRGFAPVIHDAQPEPFEIHTAELTTTYPGHSTPMASLADGIPARFWSLTRRFGWWGLPYLETLLRLADQAESANPTPAP